MEVICAADAMQEFFGNDITTEDLLPGTLEQAQLHRTSEQDQQRAHQAIQWVLDNTAGIIRIRTPIQPGRRAVLSPCSA